MPDPTPVNRREAAFREQISSYFVATYGKDYVYQPPEAFLPFERWLYAVASGDVDFGARVMANICASRAGVTERDQTGAAV